jgi:acetamidase/formamidase
MRFVWLDSNLERLWNYCKDFPDPYLKIWDLSPAQVGKGYAVLKEGIHIPIRPFLGVVGVAPGDAGEFSTIPPLDAGGNIDCKYVTRGSTLYLPIKVEGVLFSCGDGHAGQGDGEVGGSAIETPVKVSVRLTVEKNKLWLRSPQYLTNPESLAQAEVLKMGEYGCLGIDKDLLEASRKACKHMLAWLIHTKDLTREEACVLMSVAGDLKIVEAVDMPNYAVSMSIPLSIFVGEVMDHGSTPIARETKPNSHHQLPNQLSSVAAKLDWISAIGSPDLATQAIRISGGTRRASMFCHFSPLFSAIMGSTVTLSFHVFKTVSNPVYSISTPPIP